MRKQTLHHALKGWVIVPVLWLTGLALAADAPKPRPQQAQENLELDEILVEGRKPETSTRKLIAWIDRLVGQYSYEGHVERRNSSGAAIDRVEVHGQTQCVRFGRSVAVQCQIDAAWSAANGSGIQSMLAAMPALNPAIAVYGLDPVKTRISHLQVDGKGIATGGKGWILDDTLISRTPCADFPGKCERVLRLEVPPDAKVIRMRVDLERNGKLEVRYSYQWNRLPQVAVAAVKPAVPAATTPQPAMRRADSAVPSDVEAWLRRMVGRFKVRDGPGCKPGKNELGMEVVCREDEPDERDMTSRHPYDADCLGIGAGPGVRCAIYMEWPETGIRASRQSYMKLNPSYSLFGFDPVHQQIVVAGVLPIAAIGSTPLASSRLHDNKLTYQPDCSQPAMCKYATEQWEVAPDGKLIRHINRHQDRGTFLQLQFRLIRVPEGTPDRPWPTPETPKVKNPSPRRP